MDYNVIYYYNENNNIYYIEDEDVTNELKIMDVKDLYLADNKFHSFRMFETYENTHEELIRYKNDFNREVNEIKAVKLKNLRTKKYFNLNYKNFYGHHIAVYNFFLTTVDKETLEAFEKVDEEEFYIFERCLNSGLITINLDYINKPVQCYGQDFSRYYPHLMQNVRLPQQKGEKHFLNDVPFGKLLFGIYRVRINYTNSSFTNIFNFSSEHHYHSTTLNYLYSVKDKYGLTFQLLTDDKYNYNAYIYNTDSLVQGKYIFKNWFKMLEKLREECPKNRLVKHLMSSLWGTLCSYKKEYINDDELENYDLTYLDDPDASEYKIIKFKDEKCHIVKSTDAYNYGLARIKPFLTSFGRLKIMTFLHQLDIEDSVIRIHTDGIVFNKPYDFSKMDLDYYPKPEDKSTGLMRYKNAVYGFHICTRCNGEFPYKDFKCHSC